MIQECVELLNAYLGTTLNNKTIKGSSFVEKIILKLIYMKINLKILILILFFGCRTPNSNNKLNNLKINLSLIKGDKIAFNSHYDTWQISSLNEKLPAYYAIQLKNSGLNLNDSIVISTWNTSYNNFYFEMYKQGFISKENFIKKRIDSTREVLKPKQKQLLVATKFTNNNQVLIFDENNNKDFSDDKSIFFDKKFRINASDSSVIKNLPIFSFQYWNYKNNKIDYFNRKFIIYPSLNNNKFSYTENETTKKSRIILKLKDYWSGSMEVNQQKYYIAIQGFYNSFLTILIRPDTLEFSREDFTYNENFAFKIKDSIKLGNQIFQIDSITNDVKSLILRPIKAKSIYGFRMGQKIKNFKLNNLKGEKNKLYEFTKNKKYTLLDFWGTWCKPCVESIPDLKAFHKKYHKKVNFLSIAFDKDIKKVKDFVDENDMTWKHFYQNRSNSIGIIKDLNIKFFPTTILIDNNQNIVYRGSGSNDLEKVFDLITKSSN